MCIVCSPRMHGLNDNAGTCRSGCISDGRNCQAPGRTENLRTRYGHQIPPNSAKIRHCASASISHGSSASAGMEAIEVVTRSLDSSEVATSFSGAN